jgi:hypothetical protein
MNSNEIQNDKIKSTLIKVETLQKEYEVTLQQYQEAGKNYITSLQSVSSNPCSTYQKDSSNISQACYEKIWADQGCSTTGVVNATTDWAKSQTLDGLVNDSYLWATLTDDTHRKGCYGDSTTYTTNTSPVYPNNNSANFYNNVTALKGRTWWGTSGLSEGPVSTQEECENMCANSDECSGATFNPVKRYCWTRKGETTITAGRDDDYALITQQKAALSVMKYLNERLLNLNNQIKDELQNIKPEVSQQYEEKNQKQQELNVSYNKLLEQKIELDKQLQDYYSVEQEENNQSIYVTQQNVSFRFWSLITALVLLVTIKRMFGSESPPISMTIWLLIIIILIILTYSLSTPAGFLMWFVLLVAIVLMKSGHLPSP